MCAELRFIILSFKWIVHLVMRAVEDLSLVSWHLNNRSVLLNHIFFKIIRILYVEVYTLFKDFFYISDLIVNWQLFRTQLHSFLFLFHLDCMFLEILICILSHARKKCAVSNCFYLICRAFLSISDNPIWFCEYM